MLLEDHNSSTELNEDWEGVKRTLWFMQLPDKNDEETGNKSEKESRRITFTQIGERHEKLVDQRDEARIGTKLNFIKARRWNGPKVYVV